MSKSALVYCEGSDTLRLMPKNYLVAHRHKCYWVCDPDAAVPIELAVKVFTAIHTNHDVRHGSGLSLLAAVTPTWDGVVNHEEVAKSVMVECGWEPDLLTHDSNFDKLVDGFKLLNATKVTPTYNTVLFREKVREKAIQEGWANNIGQITDDMIRDDGRVVFAPERFYSTYVKLTDFEVTE